MQIYDPHEVDVDTSEVSNGTLSKAFRFATTRLKVGRAFSFNKTPSKLKRAVSSMMSPFGSSTNLTPASQLAQMKLASYSNLNVSTFEILYAITYFPLIYCFFNAFIVNFLV